MLAGEAENVLTSGELTLDNFRKVFSGAEFWTVLRVTFYYTIFGTAGALVIGVCSRPFCSIPRSAAAASCAGCSCFPMSPR